MFDFNKLPELQTGIPGQDVKTPGFNFNNLPEVGAPAPTPEKEPGFVQSAIQGIVKPFLKTAVTPYAIAKGAIELSKGNTAAADEALTKEYDFGYFGKTKALGADISPTSSAGEVLRKGGKEVLGTALELGSNLVGGGGTVGVGKSLLKSQLGKAIVSTAKVGAKVGAMGAGGRALQEDKSVGDIAAETALGAGVGALGGATLGVAGVGAKALMTPLSTVTQKIAPALENMAAGIEKTVLRDNRADRAAGFKAENVLKHDLGGTVKDTIEKATAKLKQLRQEASAMRAGSDKLINLNDIVQEAANDVTTNRLGGFGVNRNMEKAFANFVKEMEYISPDGKLTVPQAQEVKEALGSFGSWVYGQKDLDATAQERVANILYSKVKTAIEKNSPKELQGINRQMAEIIPIKNVAIKRLPVEERNNAIGLSDILSAGIALQNPAGWGLLILNNLQKSGRFAQKLYKGAGSLKAGAENISNKMKGLRITPETLLNRNKTLRTAKNILPTKTTKVAPVATSIALPKNETKPILNIVEKMPAKKIEEPKLRTNIQTSLDVVKKLGQRPYLSGSKAPWNPSGIGWKYKDKNGNILDVPEEMSKILRKEKFNFLEKNSTLKKSNNLYHSTSKENLDSIIKNGLKTGQKPRFDGISSPNKISFSANEDLAKYYGGDVMLRTNKSYQPKKLEFDLLAGGEGAYLSGNNVPPDMLEIKVGGKWIPLLDYNKTKKLRYNFTDKSEENKNKVLKIRNTKK